MFELLRSRFSGFAWVVALLLCCAGLPGCRCGESTPSAPPPATEEMLVEAMAKALCETDLARDMVPLQKSAMQDANETDATTEAWRRLLWKRDEQLAPFAQSGHLAEDTAAHERMAKATLVLVWSRCASRVAAHLGPRESRDVQRLFSHATQRARRGR